MSRMAGWRGHPFHFIFLRKRLVLLNEELGLMSDYTRISDSNSKRLFDGKLLAPNIVRPLF